MKAVFLDWWEMGLGKFIKIGQQNSLALWLKTGQRLPKRFPQAKFGIYLVQKENIN